MEDLSLHILDIVENSIKASATLVSINIEEDLAADLLSVEIGDNGSGIVGRNIEDALDPFFTSRTERKVGLGLPLLAQSAMEAEGSISIRPASPTGTNVRASFRHSHIDRKPLGNIIETLMVLIAGNPSTDFLFTYRKAGTSYSFDTRLIRAELEGIPINAPSVLSFIRGYLKELLAGTGLKGV